MAHDVGEWTVVAQPERSASRSERLTGGRCMTVKNELQFALNLG